MTDDDKKYMNEAIEKALKPISLLVPPPQAPSSNLQKRLVEVEDRLEALILSLQELLPEKDWKGMFSAAYNNVKNRPRGGAPAQTSFGIDDLLDSTNDQDEG